MSDTDCFDCFQLPKVWRNQQDRPQMSPLTTLPFTLSLLVLLWVYFYLFWWQSWRILPILKLISAVGAVAALLGRKLALAMLRRRIGMHIAALPAKKKVS